MANKTTKLTKKSGPKRDAKGRFIKTVTTVVSPLWSPGEQWRSHSDADLALARTVVAAADRDVRITVMRRTRTGMGAPVVTTDSVATVVTSQRAVRRSTEDHTYVPSILSIMVMAAVVMCCLHFVTWPH